MKGSVRFAKNVCGEKFANRNFWQITQFFFHAICQIAICQKFMTCVICRNVVFNDANVVFMTCNDRQYWSKRMSKGLRAKRAPSDSPAERPVLFSSFCDVFGKSLVFCSICQNFHFVSANRDLTHRPSANRYPSWNNSIQYFIVFWSVELSRFFYAMVCKQIYLFSHLILSASPFFPEKSQSKFRSILSQLT